MNIPAAFDPKCGMFNPKKGCTKAGLLDENGRYLQNLTDDQKMVTVPLLSIVAHRMAFLDVQTYICTPTFTAYDPSTWAYIFDIKDFRISLLNY